jgi:hypothetical protein
VRVIIEIDCDNAAFDDTPYREFSRILDKVIDEIGEFRIHLAEEGNHPLFDSNGNKVGELKIVNA